MASVSGKIISAQTGKPISGIGISLAINGSGSTVNGISDETDDQGDFYLSGLELDPKDETDRYFISVVDPTNEYGNAETDLYGFGGDSEYQEIQLYPLQVSKTHIPSWVYLVLMILIVYGFIYFSKYKKIF